MFDLSNQRAINARTWSSSSFFEDNVHKLAIAMGQKEVLVAFRGHIPETMFELSDQDTCLVLGQLKTIVDQVATAGRGPRFFHTSRSQYSTVQIVYGTVLYTSCFVYSRFDVWKP